MSYEENIIEFETRRNELINGYFEARPQIDRTMEKEKFMEAGFRMAWVYLKLQSENDSV
jgi:hypothetical protein